MAKQSAKWIQKDNRLIKSFGFKTFPSAIAFMVEVSLFCEKTDHHPEWKNVYNKVDVELTTHDAGKITGLDRKLATHMDKVFNKYS
jgi:4a-hydroxytetrahydrobiopterin dehydratase